ncbi:hypothetical protein MW887_003080 [Aspergillus wentii]|nr:hypothetical protein MW887_003080 [Aspergillus wentii]
MRALLSSASYPKAQLADENLSTTDSNSLRSNYGGRLVIRGLDMAVKRYNRGRRHGISPLSVSHLEINTYNPGMTTMVSVEPRICRGKGGASTFLLKI